MRNVLEGAGSDLRSLQDAEEAVARLADSEAYASSAGRWLQNPLSQLSIMTWLLNVR